MRKLKKGDQVLVLTGKDKGKKGKIISIVGDNMVIVEGVNIVRKHQRALPMKGVQGGIIEKSMPIHLSNVGLFNPATNKSDKVGFRLLGDGRKVRYYKSTNEVVDI